MTFDNSRTIISLRIKLFIATVLVLTYVFLTYGIKKIEFPLLGMSDSLWTVIIVGIYSVYAFFPMIINYQFIFFSDEGDTIELRYFTAGIVGGKKNSVKIEKSSFSGYKIESRYFGLIRSLILYQNFREGVAKYPPVYISALNREERQKLLKTLSLYSPQS